VYLDLKQREICAVMRPGLVLQAACLAGFPLLISWRAQVYTLSIHEVLRDACAWQQVQRVHMGMEALMHLCSYMVRSIGVDGNG